MSIAIKICGLSDEVALRAAIQAGAAFVGFNFVPTSRRYVTPEQAAVLLAACGIDQKPHQIQPQTVGLFVDPTDKELTAALAQVRLDYIQLHGKETPGRVLTVKKMTGLPVIKAIPVATPEDLACLESYDEVADILLFDTKLGPEPTGGTGKSFDWALLRDIAPTKPWMLAGGLHAGNLRAALDCCAARIIDVSSGVETAGSKDPLKIKELMILAQNLD